MRMRSVLKSSLICLLVTCTQAHAFEPIESGTFAQINLICDLSAEEQRKVDREFQEREFAVKKQQFGIQHPWQHTEPYGSIPFHHRSPPGELPMPGPFDDEIKTVPAVAEPLSPRFLGRWLVQAHRQTIEALSDFQYDADVLCPLNAKFEWLIANEPTAKPTLMFDHTLVSLSIDKIEKDTLFCRLERPIGREKSLWTMIISLVASGRQFNGIAHISVKKDGKPVSLGVIRITGQRLESEEHTPIHRVGYY